MWARHTGGFRAFGFVIHSSFVIQASSSPSQVCPRQGGFQAESQHGNIVALGFGTTVLGHKVRE